MKNYTFRGYLCGISAAISYGTNPLFALPMISSGLKVNSILFYRYFLAILIYGFWLKLYKKISLKITLKEFGILFILGIIFSLSSLFLFDAFKYMEAGLACTVLFTYPLIVAILSKIFFKEDILPKTWLSIFTVIVGITLLYSGNPDGHLNTKGVILVLLSSLSYAIYMVGTKYIKQIKNMKSDKLTFYIMLLGLSVYIWNLKFCTELQPLNNYLEIVCAIMLALFPTIISLESISISIKIIGATKTAILGALEPLTALFIGVLLFGEVLTLKIVFGIALVLIGVLFVITSKIKK